MTLSPQTKILINGCSHTKAVIPGVLAENHAESAWPHILTQSLNFHIDNVAKGGKANHVILEETLRIILNPNTYTHVIVQTTEFDRINFFNKKFSGQWNAGDIDSQTRMHLRSNTGQWFQKLPGWSKDDLRFTKSIGPDATEQFDVGDDTHTYEQVTTASLLAALYEVCLNKNIKLGILPYFGFHVAKNDRVLDNVPNTAWIVSNYEYGLYNDLLYFYDTPDTWHLEAAAHIEIASIVSDWLLDGTQVAVNTAPFDNAMRNWMFVYD